MRGSWSPKMRSAIWSKVSIRTIAGASLRRCLRATKLVGRPSFFSMAIIMLAFMPVFALTGQEGKLFHPLAFAKTFAMVGATAIAVTLVPVLCMLLLRGKISLRKDQNPVMRLCSGSTGPCSVVGARSPRDHTGHCCRLFSLAQWCLATAHRQRVHAAAQ